MFRRDSSRAQIISSVCVGVFIVCFVAVLAPAQTSRTGRTSQHRKSPARPAVALTEPIKTAGVRTAPITMEVFSDFQCPSCRMLYEQTLRPLLNDYVAQGKVYLIHRDFPLSMHPYSQEAARWANAAARMGEFEPVAAAIFDNQASWSVDGNVEKYVAQALSPQRFQEAEKLVRACRSQSSRNGSPVLESTAQTTGACSLDTYIDKDKKLGDAVPVMQTPTSIITYKGKKYPVIGVVSYPVLKQFFDQLLSQ